MADELTPEEFVRVQATAAKLGETWMSTILDQNDEDILVTGMRNFGNAGAAGVPALTIPNGLDPNGRPQGIILSGPYLSYPQIIAAFVYFVASIHRRIALLNAVFFYLFWLAVLCVGADCRPTRFYKPRPSPWRPASLPAPPYGLRIRGAHRTLGTRSAQRPARLVLYTMTVWRVVPSTAIDRPPAGNLRVPHFFGLYAMQVLSLLGGLLRLTVRWFSHHQRGQN